MNSELDKNIAIKIMGWELLTIGYFNTEDETPRQRELEDWIEEHHIDSVGTYWIVAGTHFWLREDYWEPSKRIDQAWQVLEKFSHPTWSIRMFGNNGGWVCDLMINTRAGSLYRAKKLTAPEAICQCALNTLQRD